MVEFLSIFRFQFKKREPILVAALTYTEAISRLYSSDFAPEDDDQIESISLFNNLEILV